MTVTVAPGQNSPNHHFLSLQLMICARFLLRKPAPSSGFSSNAVPGQAQGPQTDTRMLFEAASSRRQLIAR